MHLLRVLPCLLMAWTVTVLAQQGLLPASDPFLRVRHLPGISDRALYTAVQDADGRVWFASWAGLLVTNGVDVTHYRHDSEDPSTIAGRSITHLSIEGDSLMWLATENGPCAFLLGERRAVRIAGPVGDVWPRCNQVFTGEDHRRWFATNEGLFSLKDLDSSPDPHGPATWGDVRAVHPWPGDPERLLVVAADAVYTYTPGTGEWLPLPHPVPGTPYSAGHSIVHDGSLWLSHWGLGVVRYDLLNGGGGPITYVRPDGYPASFTAHFCARDTHSLWVSTLDAGMMVLDTRESRFFARHPLEGSAREQLGMAVRVPLALRDGTTLLCTDLGAYQLSRPRHRSVFHGFPDDGVVEVSPIWVSALVEDDRDGGLYVGTYDGPGLLRMDRNGTWRMIDLPREPTGRSPRIDRLLMTREGTLWIAGRHGVYRMERTSRAIVRVNVLDGFRVRALFEDSDGLIWAGSTDAGVLRLDAGGRLIAHHRRAPDDPGSLISDLDIRGLAEDTLGRIWVGTLRGLSVLDPATGSCFNFGHDPLGRNGFTEPRIRGIVRDSRGGMWLSCAMAGVRSVAVDADGGFAQHLPGLGGASALEATQDLVIDTQDRIWAVDFGIGMLDTRSGETRRFTQHDGIATLQSLDAALLVTRDGRLMIGVEGEPGIQVFDTRELLAPGAPPPIEWTHILGANGPLTLEASSTGGQGIRLPWAEQPLRIGFAAIDMSFPMDHRYHYRVPELDTAWSDLGVERSLIFAALPPGAHTLQVRSSLNGRMMGNVRSLAITIQAPWYRTPLFQITATLLLLLAAVLLVRARIGTIRRKAAIQRRLAEVEMQALRAQMNPHFLFNSLNSIKYYALTKDPRSTAAYLGTFAQLIRTILRNSRSPLVPLRDELEALRLYVEIEALRLEDKFGWRFDVDPALDPDAIMVPPMLLQPYVENAIWHGLMNKEGHGELRVTVTGEGEHVRCEIEDDGIGRAKAEELKQGQGARERSFGMRITAERMELAAKALGLGVTARVEDLRHADGAAAGTRITVHIPITLETGTP
ncbi:MAG: histidine kinase [Flavobacteriales bacterium]|nr:histidine kinase [Flavobacteriales bacterium]